MTDIERFVASLAIPADRKAVVLAELGDHVACARDAATREGRDPDAAERAAVGDLESLRRSFEAIEPAFRVTRLHALVRGLVAAALVSIVIDQTGNALFGTVGAVVGIAIAIVAAPPRLLDLLHADLRARPVQGPVMRGVPIGPGVTYLITIAWAPFTIWIGMFVVRGFLAGRFSIDVLWSAWVVMFASLGLLGIEAVRARRVPAQ